MPKRKTDEASPEAKRFITGEQISPILPSDPAVQSPSAKWPLIPGIKKALQNCTDSRSPVYEKIILQIINTHPRDKRSAVEFERDVIQLLRDEISSDKVGTRIEEILDALESLFKTKSISHLVHKFVFSLLVGLVPKIPSVLHLTRLVHFIESLIKNVIQVYSTTRRFAWLKSCTSGKNLLEETRTSFSFKTVIDRLSMDDAAKGMLEVATRLVANCASAKSADVSSEAKQEILSLSAKIFQDLFHNVSHTRIPIAIELLEKALNSIHHKNSIHLDQLEAFMNSDSVAKNLFNDKMSEQRDEILRLVISRIQSRISTITDSSDVPTDAYFKLFNALRSLFFLATPNDIQQLLKFIKSHKTNSQTVIKSLLLVVLLRSIQKADISYERNFDSFQTKRHIEASQPNIMAVILQLKDITEKPISAHIKSLIYQAFYHSATDAKNFDFVLSFFKSKIESLIVKSKEYCYFDLNKCIAHSENGCRLIEPVDMLFRCVSTLCGKASNTLETTSRQLRDAKEIVSKFVKTYVEGSAELIFEQYKGQTMAKSRSKLSLSQLIPIRYQLELGLFDSVIEYLVVTEQFVHLRMLTEKRTTMNNVFHTYLEELKNPPRTSALKATQSLAAKSTKRKQPISTTIMTRSKSAYKKSKTENESDKENEPGFRRMVGTSLRSSAKKVALKTITNFAQSSKRVASEEAEVAQEASEADEKALVDIQLEYIPRASLETCVLMINIAVCFEKGFKFISNSCAQDSLVTLITDTTFSTYVFDMIGKKLELLSSKLLPSHDASVPANDFQNLADSDSSIFAFLITAWNNLIIRINGCNIVENKCFFQPNFAQRYHTPYLETNLRLIGYCRSIWSLVDQRWPEKRHELLACDKPHQLIDHCWKFMSLTAQTISIYLNPTQINRSVASRCCAQLLDLMCQVLRVVKLPSSRYENILHWLTELSCDNLSSQIEMLKSIFNLMELLHENLASPALLIKQMAVDLTVETSQTIDQSNPYCIEDGTQYRLINTTNCLEYQKILLRKATSYLNEMTRMLSLKCHACPSKMTVLLARQAEMLIVALKLFSNMPYDQSNIKALSEANCSLFDFMTALFNFIGSKKIAEDYVEMAKHAVTGSAMLDLITLVPSLVDSTAALTEVTSPKEPAQKMTDLTSSFMHFKNSLKIVNIKV